MSDLVEWLNVALRWTHVFAAILWVGTTYLFNFMEKSLERDESTPENVRGVLWMVHGGGFYFVEKQKVPALMPRTLHWFKYESAVTWLSGTVLLLLAYYHGGLLIEPEQSFGKGALVGLGAIAIGWVAYDLLVRSPLGQREELLAAIGWLGIVGASYVLGRYLSPRAVLIHVGAMLGTIMAANVWMRILPSQQKMLDAVKVGKQPAAGVAATGPLRSKQNSYLAIPLVFLMVSNHYPTIHGSKRNWLVVGAMMIAGWIVARMFRGATKPGEGAPGAKSELGPVHAAIALVLLFGGEALAWKLAPALSSGTTAAAPPPPKRVMPAADKPAPLGQAVLRGVVRFDGSVPEPEAWGGARMAECQGLREPTLALVSVRDGKLRDAFVYVKDGLPEGSYDAPSAPAVIDQKGCEFAPRVLGLVVGQKLEVVNSDPLLHNVRSDELNQAFPRGARRAIELDEPAVMTALKCDVHPWMRGYVGVMEHPYFAVTGDDGAFAIEKLVDGEYTVAVWHEKLGTTEKKVKVSAAQPAETELTLRSR